MHNNMTNLNYLHDAIVKGNLELSVETTKSAIAEGIDPQSIIRDYMIPAMDKIGGMFENCEAFVPELLMAARAMKGSLAILQPLLTASGIESKGKVIIGTVKGDLHDIGKNIVGSMLEGAGFQVINLGNDVSPEKFIEAINTHKPQIVAMSALLTTTMTSMEKTIIAIREAGLRDKVRIMIGGAPVSSNYSDKIGADGYSDNANSAVKLARALIG
jgi:corrinoid protein of di/trimethylamine methyltransferase